jgi:uncharacterized alpha-E superfamily protein
MGYGDDESILDTNDAASVASSQSIMSVDSVMTELAKRPRRRTQKTADEQLIDEMATVLKRFKKAMRRVPVGLAQRYQFTALLGWGVCCV